MFLFFDGQYFNCYSAANKNKIICQLNNNIFPLSEAPVKLLVRQAVDLSFIGFMFTYWHKIVRLISFSAFISALGL